MPYLQDELNLQLNSMFFKLIAKQKWLKLNGFSKPMLTEKAYYQVRNNELKFRFEFTSVLF